MNDYKNYTWHRFWLKSSRGTDIHEYKFLPPNVDPGYALEDWAHIKGGLMVSIEYGRKKISIPPKKVLANLCLRRGRRIDRETEELRVWEKMLHDTFGHPGG